MNPGQLTGFWSLYGRIGWSSTTLSSELACDIIRNGRGSQETYDPDWKGFCQKMICINHGSKSVFEFMIPIRKKFSWPSAQLQIVFCTSWSCRSVNIKSIKIFNWLKRFFWLLFIKLICCGSWQNNFKKWSVSSMMFLLRKKNYSILSHSNDWRP